MHISPEKPQPSALVKGENCKRVGRKASITLAYASAAALLLLSAASRAPAQQAVPTLNSVSLTFSAYNSSLNGFPFAQSAESAANAGATVQATAQQPSQTPANKQSDLPDAPSAKYASQASESNPGACAKPPCKTKPPIVDWYMRFVTGPTPKVLTPRDKAYIAARSVIDPFNVITILGEGAISVAADSHSAYGPGFPGFARYVGVSFTEDITGEFFNTFLIPSLTHQDPRFHRIPQDTIPKRIFHAIYQVAWTQGDHGKRMLNYGNLVGFAIDDEIGNLYVPGRRTNASATAQRYVIGLATAPIDNFISEFLPDVAKHVHIQVVVVQRIINHIAGNDNNAL